MEQIEDIDTRTANFMDGLREIIKQDDEKRKQRKRKVKVKSVLLTKLSEDYARWRLKQPTGCKQPSISSFSEDSANSLTKAIIAHIFCHGGFAGRINSTGTFKQKEGRFIRSGSRDGMADVNACINGIHIQIEIKYGKDKPRESQLSVQREVESAGGHYFFVHTFDEYIGYISRFIPD